MLEPRFGWVLYDGACGFCAWWVPFWGKTFEPRLLLGLSRPTSN
jgi:predicted DCC family thiol-disulfide oxidoreductase YuxK